MSKQVGIVIQARMGSTRFPGKVLADFCGKPMLQYQIDRVKKFGFPYQIVVATSIADQDNAISEFCSEADVTCFRGDEANVLKRFIGVAQAYEFEHIVRLTGDNPMVDCAIFTRLVKTHLEKMPDLTSTRKILSDHSIIRFAPKGKSIDLLKSSSLIKIDTENLTEFEKEHVIPLFYFQDDFEVNIVKDFFGLEDNEYSIDTIEDHKRIVKIAEAEKVNNYMQKANE